MPRILAVGFADDFARSLATKVSIPGVRPVDAVEQLLTETFIHNLRGADFSLVKPPSVKLHAMYFKERGATLAQLARQGYETWYSELLFSTKIQDVVESITLETTGLETRPINYGPAGDISHKLWSKKLRTQANHILRLNHLVIPPTVFSDAIKALEELPPLQQPFIANPRPGPRSHGFDMGVPGFEFVSFDHITSGARHFCSCARIAHTKMKQMTARMSSGPDAWPSQIVRLLTDIEYRDEVCHLCVARRSGAEAAGYLYGDAVQDFVLPYIDQLVAEGMDKATARSEVQQTLGISRWVREAEMYNIVKKLFPDQVIMREASPAWLGRQRLDVFIPALNLALEHQGEQHYVPVRAFGGDDAHRRGLERAALK